jgi:ribonuclease P protein component
MTGAKPTALGFPRRARLLTPPQFDAVYATRLRVVDGMFSINAARNTLGYPRLGLSIGSKAAGNSVQRNRVKRQVRESFRKEAGTLPALDLVVGARNGVRTAHNARLRESLAELWTEIRKRCEPLPAP